MEPADFEELLAAAASTPLFDPTIRDSIGNESDDGVEKPVNSASVSEPATVSHDRQQSRLDDAIRDSLFSLSLSEQPRLAWTASTGFAFNVGPADATDKEAAARAARRRRAMQRKRDAAARRAEDAASFESVLCVPDSNGPDASMPLLELMLQFLLAGCFAENDFAAVSRAGQINRACRDIVADITYAEYSDLPPVFHGFAEVIHGHPMGRLNNLLAIATHRAGRRGDDDVTPTEETKVCLFAPYDDESPPPEPEEVEVITLRGIRLAHNLRVLHLGYPRLVSLTLNHCKITRLDVPPPGMLYGLKRLDLTGNAIESGLDALKRLSYLKTLILRRNRIRSPFELTPLVCIREEITVPCMCTDCPPCSPAGQAALLARA